MNNQKLACLSSLKFTLLSMLGYLKDVMRRVRIDRMRRKSVSSPLPEFMGGGYFNCRPASR